MPDTSFLTWLLTIVAIPVLGFGLVVWLLTRLWLKGKREERRRQADGDDRPEVREPRRR